MSRITEKEVKRRLKSVGAILIGKYSTLDESTKFKCPDCGKYFERKPKNVLRYPAIYCKKCSYANRRKANKIDVDVVQSRLKEYGFELIDPTSYKNVSTLTNIKCHCGKEFIAKCAWIFCGNTKSCGHCNDPEVGDKLNSLTITKVIPNTNGGGGCTIEAICDCGNKVGPRIFGEIRKSCGHCNDPKVGDRFGKWTITKAIPSNNTGCQVVCKCECGTIMGPISPSNLVSGSSTRCLHCNAPKVGDKFNKLTVKQVVPYNKNGRKYLCDCECGNMCGPYSAVTIQNGNTKSCGQCNTVEINDKFEKLTVIMIFYNNSGGAGASIVCECECGTDVSMLNNVLVAGHYSSCGCGTRKSRIVSEKLLTSIQKILGTNYKTDEVIEQRIDGWPAGIDILIDNIAIEYDSYYWHREYKDTSNAELRKNQAILNAGYKLLRIRSNGNDIPSEKQLRKHLNDLQNGASKRTHTMPSWRKLEKAARMVR